MIRGGLDLVSGSVARLQLSAQAERRRRAVLERSHSRRRRSGAPTARSTSPCRRAAASIPASSPIASSIDGGTLTDNGLALGSGAGEATSSSRPRSRGWRTSPAVATRPDAHFLGTGPPAPKTDGHGRNRRRRAVAEECRHQRRTGPWRPKASGERGRGRPQAFAIFAATPGTVTGG